MVSAFFIKTVSILIILIIATNTPCLRHAFPKSTILSSVISEGIAMVAHEFVGYFAFAQLVGSLSKSYVECNCDRRAAQRRQISLV